MSDQASPVGRTSSQSHARRPIDPIEQQLLRIHKLSWLYSQPAPHLTATDAAHSRLPISGLD